MKKAVTSKNILIQHIKKIHIGGLLLIMAYNVGFASACSISVSPLIFGIYNPDSGFNNDSTGTITISCAMGTSYSISLNNSGDNRRMTGPNDEALIYNIYTDSAYQNIWGDGTNGTSIVSGSITSLTGSNNHTLFGRLFPKQDKPSGLYSDTLIITVTY